MKSQHSDLFSFKMPDNFYKEDPLKAAKPAPTKSASIKRPVIPSGNPNLQSSSEGEDNEAMELGGGRDPRDRLLSERRLEKRERESYKHSFLTKFLEKYEDEEVKQTLKTDRPPVQAQAKPTPKSVLKKTSTTVSSV